MTSEATFWAFFRFRIFCTSFREKSSRRERISAAHTLHQLIFSIVSNSHKCATAKHRTRIFSVTGLAAFLSAARKQPTERQQLDSQRDTYPKLLRPERKQGEPLPVPSVLVFSCTFLYLFVVFPIAILFASLYNSYRIIHKATK